MSRKLDNLISDAEDIWRNLIKELKHGERYGFTTAQELLGDLDEKLDDISEEIGGE